MQRLILLAICSLNACSLNDFEGPTTTGRNSLALMGGLRARADFGKDEERFNIGLETSANAASSDVSVAGSSTRDVDGFDMVQVFAGARANIRFEPFEVGLFLGPANTNVTFDVGPSGEHHNRFGGLIGAEIQWHPHPKLTPYARGTFVFNNLDIRLDEVIPTIGYANPTSSFEVGVKYHITEDVRAFLSVRRWRYHAAWNGGTWDGSELDLESEGVSIGMEFTF